MSGSMWNIIWPSSTYRFQPNHLQWNDQSFITSLGLELLILSFQEAVWFILAITFLTKFIFWTFFNQIRLSFLDFHHTRIKKHWEMFKRQTSLFMRWCLSCTSQIVTKHQHAHSWVILFDKRTYLSPKFCLLSPET